MSTIEILMIFLGICALGLAFYYGKRELRRARKRGYFWSIGYQRSSDPFQWSPQHAKIYGRSQIPLDVKTLADPFMVKHQDTLYLFHEVVLKSSPYGKLAVSVYDAANDKWDFKSIVLEEPFHMSYPYVFSDGGEFYMIPESKQSKTVRLYRATDFPYKWALEKILIDNKKFADPSILFWENRYYLFVTRKRRLYLYYSDQLTHGWRLHPKSPVKIWNFARCAGRIFEHNDCLYRFAQEQVLGYGKGVRTYKILELSPTSYKEIPFDEKKILKPFGNGWAEKGMHHLDILKISENNFFGVFDGRGSIES
jgi:hypothetical protein